MTINKNLWSKERKVKEVEIPIKKLKSIIESDNIEKIDLMKIDVETHEFEVLEGMADYLFRYKLFNQIVCAFTIWNSDHFSRKSK